MTAVVERVERLNRASLRRVIEPDVDLPGAVGDGQLMADELLSVAGMDLGLTAEQRRILSREEVASMFSAGTRFEAVLEIGVESVGDDASVADQRRRLGQDRRGQ